VKKDEMVAKTEPSEDTVKKALGGIFPTVASFLNFKENDREISQRAIPGIIQYAFNQSIIDSDSEKAFIDFLNKNSNPAVDHRLPDSLTFSNVLDILADHLSVNALIAQLDTIAQTLCLPGIQAPMITRLKKKFLVNTPKKRALLRILAFRLAWKRPDLNWDYELLLQLPSSSLEPAEHTQEKSGVTISFHLRGQGGIIVPTDVAWLKNELTACIDYLRIAGHIHKKMVETIGATSFAFRSAKEPGPTDEPRLFAPTIRVMLAIAHQMSVRWLLCPHSSPRKQLLMMIDAGLMTEAHKFDFLLPENNQPNDSGIYLTDFAHLCAGIANLKGFQRCDSPGHSTNGGYTGNIWSVIYFWPNHFYDYIPYLLTEKMLPASNTDAAYDEFRRALHFPEQNSRNSFGAIAAMHRFPQSSLLLIEITKVLRARQMPHEADAVLTNLLLSNPNNLAARFMRMLIYSHIAGNEPDFATSGLAFERGLAEGRYITESLDANSEVWSAMGVLHLNRAMKIFRCLRHGNPSIAQSIRKEDIPAHLKNAKKCFLRGLAASPTGQSVMCLFWLQYTLSFIDLFFTDEKLLSRNHHTTLLDHKNVFRQNGRRLFKNIGWIRNDLPVNAEISEEDFQNMIRIAMITFSRYENALLGRSYIPNIYYQFGIMLWDFSPRLTPQVCKAILSLFQSARLKAEKLRQDNICVYTILARYIPADQFIAHIKQMIGVIRGFISDEDVNKGDNFPISPAKTRKMSKTKLMLLEVDRH
jgi:hypothetical protein